MREKWAGYAKASGAAASSPGPTTSTVQSADVAEPSPFRIETQIASPGTVQSVPSEKPPPAASISAGAAPLPARVNATRASETSNLSGSAGARPPLCASAATSAEYARTEAE
jgi:hypothetical protein